MGKLTKYLPPKTPRFKIPQTLSRHNLFLSLFLTLNLFVLTALLVIFTNTQTPAFSKNNLDLEIQNSQSSAVEISINSLSQKSSSRNAANKNLASKRITENQSLPASQLHPLPSTLKEWQDISNSGDYFSQIKPTPVGYLVWSQFPVKIYITTLNKLPNQQAQTWVETVSQAINEWQNYLPLEIVTQPEIADIMIERKAPPLKFDRNRKISRARSAQTTYEFYTKNNTLYHRFTILLSPSQTGKYLLAATRHELGHALGIWGHSPVKSDALYFSQVRNPLPISARDVNTLKRVYEQPTSLGWSLP